MQVRRWVRPGTEEVRYYLDFRFGTAPFLTHSAARLLAGRWIGSDDAGMAHVFTKTQHGSGRCRSEDGDWLDDAIGIAGKTFAEWEAIYTACLTKGGNFSVARYMKL